MQDYGWTKSWGEYFGKEGYGDMEPKKYDGMDGYGKQYDGQVYEGPDSISRIKEVEAANVTDIKNLSEFTNVDEYTVDATVEGYGKLPIAESFNSAEQEHFTTGNIEGDYENAGQEIFGGFITDREGGATYEGSDAITSIGEVKATNALSVLNASDFTNVDKYDVDIQVTDSFAALKNSFNNHDTTTAHSNNIDAHVSHGPQIIDDGDITV